MSKCVIIICFKRRYFESLVKCIASKSLCIVIKYENVESIIQIRLHQKQNWLIYNPVNSWLQYIFNYSWHNVDSIYFTLFFFVIFKAFAKIWRVPIGAVYNAILTGPSSVMLGEKTMALSFKGSHIIIDVINCKSYSKTF